MGLWDAEPLQVEDCHRPTPESGYWSVSRCRIHFIVQSQVEAVAVAQEAFWNLLSVHSSWKDHTALLMPLFLKGHQKGLFLLH